MLRLITILLTMLLATVPAYGVRVADITRMDGERTNILTGMGLVIGLNGTGDGPDHLPSIRMLANMLGKFDNETRIDELQKVGNVAIVTLTVTLPEYGVRNGDRMDVHLTAHAARSLRGGRLFVAPMTGPMPGSGLFALAEGAVEIQDEKIQTTAIVRGGCVMEADLPAAFIDDQGRFTLVIDAPSSSWTTASNIARVINDSEDGQTWAVALDPRNVIVTIPPAERAKPDAFISRVQQLPVPLVDTEARVLINDRTSTIVITGDVQISPVVISHNGLTISTVLPEVAPTPRTPVVQTRQFIAMDTETQGGARLRDLVDTLDQLKVPADDRIKIIKLLHESGKLHAKLVVNDKVVR